MWRDDAYLLDILIAAKRVMDFEATSRGINFDKATCTSMLLPKPLRISVANEAGC